MTRESLELLRERLLSEESVQQMIRVRAYEIYEMRGIQSGGPAQDWFEAESEVLAFLLATESHGHDNSEAEQQVIASDSEDHVKAPSRTPPKRARARQASKVRSTKGTSSLKTAKKSTSPKKPAQPKTKRSRKGVASDKNEKS